ncbi:hypothetical protein [Streptomyces sp. NPDC058330]|uniref:hypothetical protein n=1 Tax=Streptomyces sp. NPDC058330 TaxID=3346449 RepID=UPI0036EDBEF5
MDIQAIDPRDTTWEQDHGRYRVYFWDIPAATAHEYEILGKVDIDELLTWVTGYAAQRGWAYTVYVATTDGGSLGLIRLAGVQGDPFTAS